MPAPSLTELRSLVCAAAQAFDADELDARGASRALGAWSAIVNAAQVGVALAAARVDVCGPPAAAGATSSAEFVAGATGTTSARAAETIGRGRNLRERDDTRRAAAQGRLSPDQAGAIADAAMVNPEAEDELLGEADSSSVGELRRKCANKKAEREDRQAIEARIHAKRHLRRYRDADGAEHLHAAGPRVDLALIDQVLKPLIESRFRQAREEGAREPLEAYAFDALVELARKAMGEASGREGHGARPRTDPIRCLTLLRLDLDALRRGAVADDEVCEIAGLGPVSVSAARALLGESVLKLVLTKGIEVRNVTHLGRGPTTAQKVALLWEQPLCQRQGCGRRQRLEGDHIDGFEYRHTRHTRVDEIDHLCERDHDLKSRHGWALVSGVGVRPMVPPDDPRHPRWAAARAP